MGSCGWAMCHWCGHKNRYDFEDGRFGARCARCDRVGAMLAVAASVAGPTPTVRDSDVSFADLYMSAAEGPDLVAVTYPCEARRILFVLSFLLL